MSAWMDSALAIASERHDTRCAKKAQCTGRDWHIRNDYLVVAVREEASLLADELARADAWLRGAR